jgi:hypothetical protein
LIQLIYEKVGDKVNQGLDSEIFLIVGTKNEYMKADPDNLWITDIEFEYLGCMLYKYESCEAIFERNPFQMN